jgi:hypothetical protein
LFVGNFFSCSNINQSIPTIIDGIHLSSNTPLTVVVS